MSPAAPERLGVAEVTRALAARELSSVELTKHLLARITAHHGLGAFLHVDAERALAAAAHADQRRAQGDRACPLLGVPIAHKDVFVTADAPTTAGSKMLAGYASPFDATVVARLGAGVAGGAPGAGAITLGKLNCDEFAMGSANENSAYGPVHNPWDPSRVPGGSSGGSAAAVAARLVPAATGTDTGGSIRQPAAFTGITGIKPTYGVCSRYGIIAFASSLDQAGVLARSAEDCALLLSAMSGHDPRDATSAERPPQDYAAGLGSPLPSASAAKPLQGLRIGLPREFFPATLAGDVDGAVRAAVAELVRARRHAGRREPAAHRAVDPRLLHHRAGRGELEPVALRRRALRPPRRALRRPARHVPPHARRGLRRRGQAPHHDRHLRALSHGYYDAYYLQAQKLRRMIADDFQRCFSDCDVIAGPVAPSVAWKIGEQGDDPVKAYLADIFTLPASLAGLPGMSVPAGRGEHGMPVGLQLIGNYFDEARLLQVAHALQQATDWHRAVPAGV